MNDVREKLGIAVPHGRGGALLALLLAYPPDSLANVGVPLFSKYVIYSWLLLVPIIGVEAYVLRKRLGVPLGRATGVSSAANIASAFAGTIAVVLIALTGASELPGAEGDITVLFALIPCYFLSVWLETLVAAPMLAGVPRQSVRAVLYTANGFSYAMLAILAVTRFVKNAVQQGAIIW
jgi:hypothetical protein